MIRYFTGIVATFAFVVALGVAQENAPGPKKKAGEEDAPKIDAKKAPDKDAAPDAKKGEDPEAPKEEPAEDPKVIIERLKKNFGEVDENLEKKDPAEEILKRQKQIADDIQKLIDQKNNDKGGGGGGGGNSGGGSGNSGGGGASGGASGAAGGAADAAGKNEQKKPMGLNDKNNANKGGGQTDQGKQNEDKQKEKDKLAKKGDGGEKGGKAGGEQKGGKKGDGGAEAKHDDTKDKKNTIADQKMDVWGHLPANRRKEMDAFSRERFMDRYEEILRAYYRNIAETSRRKEGD